MGISPSNKVYMEYSVAQKILYIEDIIVQASASENLFKIPPTPMEPSGTTHTILRQIPTMLKTKHLVRDYYY